MNERSSALPDYPGRLSLSRMMVLVAGLGIGLSLFHQDRDVDFRDLDWWRGTAIAMLIGCSLPGVLYTTRQRTSGPRQGLGSLLWLSLSLGALLMVPPAIAGPLLHDQAVGSNSSVVCLYYTMPLASLWFILAAVVSGQLRRRCLSAAVSWGERFGWCLGLGWSVLGGWLLFDFYFEAFSP